MECHVSCHGRISGCPDAQSIAFQTQLTTLLQTHSPEQAILLQSLVPCHRRSPGCPGAQVMSCQTCKV